MNKVQPMPAGATIKLPLKDVLDWWMVSDPWPLSESQNEKIESALDETVRALGYASWVDAYHEGGTA